ncbi:hypothetical protein EXIGLDRAFT_794277, partial [Exidia glandulosa HHB12029]
LILNKVQARFIAVGVNYTFVLGTFAVIVIAVSKNDLKYAGTVAYLALALLATVFVVGVLDAYGHAPEQANDFLAFFADIVGAVAEVQRAGAAPAQLSRSGCSFQYRLGPPLDNFIAKRSLSAITRSPSTLRSHPPPNVDPDMGYGQDPTGSSVDGSGGSSGEHMDDAKPMDGVVQNGMYGYNVLGGGGKAPTSNNFVTKLYQMINDPKSAHFIS